MVFWGYCGKCPDGSPFPYWVLKPEYEKMDEAAKKRNRDSYLARREERIAYQKRYSIENKEKVKARSKAYRQKNAEAIRQRKREYAQKNREKIAQSIRNRRLKNPIARLSNSMRRGVRRYLVEDQKQNLSSFQIIGCSKEQLVAHLESKFRDGMTWSNYGRYWHVDHIVPLSSAKDTDEVLRLCHWTNLQPLTAFENISKGARIS